MVEAVIEKQTGAENVVWDLSIFYSGVDDPNFERDLERTQTMAEEYAKTYRGRVAQLDAEEMVDAMVEQEKILDLAGRIGAFAFLNFATDTTNPQYGALVQRVQEQSAKLQQTLLFFELEWKAMEPEQTDKLLANPTLSTYRHALESELRYRPYTLSEVEEQLLVEKAVTGRNAWSRFFTQLTSALRFDFEGQKLNQSQVLNYLYDADREVRRKAAESVTQGLNSRSMELTYIFNVLAADKASDDKRRGYPTWISARNLANEAPDEVVDALINAVTSNYELVARHYNLKKVLLGYDELYDYDRYAPLPIEAAERQFTWDEARDIVLNAYRAFSPRMSEIAEMFFTQKWIHAPVLPNKRGGAFSSPTVPSANPYVLVNFLGKSRDIMTLAHELGHGVHQWLSSQNQTYFNVYTPLTTAEMASVFGEMLVFNDLMNKEPDPAVRLSMLAQKVEDSFATIFRQVAMNRFEDGLHNSRRNEGELSTERINQIWMETQRAMFQGSVNLRDDYGIWWSYIGHFIGAPGYVYAYAFGELLVLALFNLYKQRGDVFVPQYLDVLAAGGSDYPEKILSKVGVDLSDTSFWNQGLEILRTLIEQEEQLAREVYPDKFGK
ncbi:MAG TPA: M3 family oligoendopeptidase [Oceanobacillus sp.]|nr:M3 family oligoendopeptidase [Oceanobacillus sp.]